MGKKTKLVELDDLYWHEMLDRVHCINIMFEEMLVNHPIHDHMKEDFDKVGGELGALYQKVADRRFRGHDHEQAKTGAVRTVLDTQGGSDNKK